MKSFTIWLAFVLAGALLLSSCKKSDDAVTNPPVTTPTHATGTYTGMIAGGTVSGVLSLNIPSGSSFAKTNHIAVVINVSGSLLIGSSTITLSGTYDTADDSLYVSGGGYTFAGLYAHGAFTGTYTGPLGSGGFSTESSSGSDSVKVYLGSSASEVSGHGSSTLNIVVKGSVLVGMAVNPNGDRTPFAGTVSGDNISLSLSHAGITAHLGSGTFNSAHTSATGTYDTTPFTTSGDADHGTWSVTLAN